MSGPQMRVSSALNSRSGRTFSGHVQDDGEIARGFEAQSHLGLSRFAFEQLAQFRCAVDAVAAHEYLDADQTRQGDARDIERNDLLHRHLRWIAFLGQRRSADQHGLIFHQRGDQAFVLRGEYHGVDAAGAVFDHQRRPGLCLRGCAAAGCR